MTKKRVSDSAVELHHFMMPEHANLLGNVHGGIILKLVDEAGALCAMRHAQRHVVTVAIDSITFHDPVRVGDVLCLTARLNFVGRTSLEVEIDVNAENPLTGHTTHTNSALAVYVALGDDGKPCPVPGLELAHGDEMTRWHEGQLRQSQRLARKRTGT